MPSEKCLACAVLPLPESEQAAAATIRAFIAQRTAEQIADGFCPLHRRLSVEMFEEDAAVEGLFARARRRSAEGGR